MKTVKCFAFVDEQNRLEPKSISLNREACKVNLFYHTNYQNHSEETWDVHSKWFDLGKVVEMFVVVDEYVDLCCLTNG